MNLQLTQALRRNAQCNPNRVAMIFGERRSTWRAVQDRVARLAGALQAMGVAKGDRVGLLALNSDRYLETMLAIWWVGAAVNPVNIRWNPGEIAYTLDDCETAVLFVDSAFAAMLPTLRQQSRSLRQVVHLDTAAEGESSFEQLVHAHQPVPDAGCCGEDLAGIFYTGGTTGRPKGVMLSQRAMVLNSLMSLAEIGMASSDTLLMNAPMFHLAGLSFLMRGVTTGASMVIQPSFSPASAFEAMASHRVTTIFSVPVMLQMMADHPKAAEFDLSSVRLVAYGASPVSEAVLDRAFKLFPNAEFAQGYGMTELSSAVCTLTGEFHTPEGRAGGRLRSAGRALPGIDLRIVDSEGCDVARGQVGELIVRSPSVMTGYWKLEEQTAEALRDGWMHTGDAATMDDDGFVYIVDRLKDMIVSGGENVFCAEVESVLARHPDVASVAVIGVPSTEWGEAVHAVVVLRAGAQTSAEALIGHCRTSIAGYKCPRSIEFRDSLPLSGAGKVLKYALRAPYWKGRERGVA